MNQVIISVTSFKFQQKPNIYKLQVSKKTMATNVESKILYYAPVINSWRNEGHFIIPNVNDQEKIITYALFEKMTRPMNLEQTSEYYETNKQKGNPHPVNSKLLFSIWNSAYDLRNEAQKESEQLRNFLKQGIRKYPNAFTSLLYTPDETDKIIHNPNTSDEYSINAKFVGPDEWFSEIPDKNILEPLFGTSDIKKINEVFQLINNTSGYLWRINDKPNKKIERGVWFYADDSGLCLDCDVDPRIEYPAFRVLRVD